MQYFTIILVTNVPTYILISFVGLRVRGANSDNLLLDSDKASALSFCFHLVGANSPRVYLIGGVLTAVVTLGTLNGAMPPRR